MIERGGSGDGSDADLPGDDTGMPDTLGASDSSILYTLAQSVGRMPRVALHATEAGDGASPDVDDLPGRDARNERIRLFDVLGRGGMGVVLRGHDADLGRDLAIKVLKEQFRDEPEMIRRFVEEAQIGGQLQHPGVVPVYELGSLADRRPYIAMRLVEGRTLAALLAERDGPGDDLPRLLSIFESVCQTMAYAHARGVIHRDLKPSNIMVGSFGEVQVMDWGLAKVLAHADGGGGPREAHRPRAAIVATLRSGSAADRSMPGSVLGTPAYMAPEQARGEVEALDERADVFALGSILCEVLTGRPAIVGTDPAEVERRAAVGDLDEANERLRDCGADAELATLAADCLAADPADRPRDARAVALRVTAYRAGVAERLRAAELATVEAQAMAVGERRRRRLAVALSASILALMVLVVGAVGWLVYQRQAWRARVAVALREAELLLGQAESDPTGDPARWEPARAASRRLLDLRDGGHDPALRTRIDGLAVTVERGADAAAADRRLVDRLEEIREGMAADDRADAEFASAFAGAGFDLLGPAADPTAIGRALARRPREVALAIASALDTWAVVRRNVAIARPGTVDGSTARRLLDAARAADPDPWRVALRDAIADADPAALRRLADDPELERRDPIGLWLLGHGLEVKGDHDRAVALLRRAHRRHPQDYWLNVELGLAALGGFRSGLGASSAWVTASSIPDPRYQQAEPYFMAAVARRPGSGAAHLLLAQSMLCQGRWADCFDEFREALRLQPRDATIHNSLGVAYQAVDDPDRADASFREALRLEPGYNLARGNLGDLLLSQGRPEEAAAVFREAIAVAPDFAPARARLGQTLSDLGRPEEAVAAYREAIGKAPAYPQAHAGLGAALRRLGDFEGAAAAFRTAFELGPDPQWQASIRFERDRTARWAELAPRLSGLLGGAGWPASPSEAVELAYLAHARLDYDGAARLFALAFRAEPRLAEDLEQAHRYNAACCASLSASGRGRPLAPAATIPAADARRSALGWLRDDLAARTRQADVADRARLLRVLGRWKVDPDLSAIRDPESLDRLPGPERDAWHALWREVDAAIASLKEGAGTSTPPTMSGLPDALRGFLDPPG